MILYKVDNYTYGQTDVYEDVDLAYEVATMETDFGDYIKLSWSFDGIHWHIVPQEDY